MGVAEDAGLIDILAKNQTLEIPIGDPWLTFILVVICFSGLASAFVDNMPHLHLQ